MKCSGSALLPLNAALYHFHQISKQNEKSMVKFIKSVGVVIGTLIVGGLGSGVWERILAPLYDFVMSWVARLLSQLSVNYENTIYINASNLADNGQAGGSVLLLLLVLTFFWVQQSLKTKTSNQHVSSFYKGLSIYFTGWFGIFLSGSALVFVLITLSTTTTSYMIKKTSVDNMNIARPYIGDESYHKLYSDFLQMQSKSDFDDFYNRVVMYANEYGFSIKVRPD